MSKSLRRRRIKRERLFRSRLRRSLRDPRRCIAVIQGFGDGLLSYMRSQRALGSTIKEFARAHVRYSQP